MNRTTETLSGSASELDHKTAELYDALRQGDSLTVRSARLQALVQSQETARKISEAGKYFMAYEFQLWSSRGRDKSEERRLELAALGAREFFKDVQEFIGEEAKIQPFATGDDGKGNLARSLNAIATTLHMINPKQEEHLKEHKGLKPITMLSMIEEGLRARADLASGKVKPESLPLYVREVLSQEKTAVFLVQVRYNFLGTLALGRMVPLDQIKKGVVKSKLKLLGRVVDTATDTDLTADLPKHNIVEIQEFAKYLKGAMLTRDLLVAVGETPALDPTLAAMYQSLNVKMSPAEQATTDASGAGKALTQPTRLAVEAELFDLTKKFAVSATVQ